MSSGNFSSKKTVGDKPVKTTILNLQTNGLFRYLQDTGSANWKAIKKYTFLRPFAWCYQLGRFVRKGSVLLFHGEKIGKQITEGNEQYTFLKRLGIG